MSYSSIIQAKIKAYDTTSYTRDYTSFFELTEYNRTYELCNEHTVGYHSGNVIKFFSYKLQKPFVIGNRDGYMSKKLEKMRAELEVVAEQQLQEEEIISADGIPDSESPEDKLLNADAADFSDTDVIVNEDIVNEADFIESDYTENELTF